MNSKFFNVVPALIAFASFSALADTMLLDGSQVEALSEVKVTAESSIDIIITPTSEYFTTSEIGSGTKVATYNVKVDGGRPGQTKVAVRMLNADFNNPHCTKTTEANDASSSVYICLDPGVADPALGNNKIQSDKEVYFKHNPGLYGIYAQGNGQWGPGTYAYGMEIAKYTL